MMESTEPQMDSKSVPAKKDHKHKKVHLVLKPQDRTKLYVVHLQRGLFWQQFWMEMSLSLEVNNFSDHDHTDEKRKLAII